MDCRLILNKNRALFAKWHGFMEFGIIFQWKIRWTGSTARGPGDAGGSMVDRGGADKRTRRHLVGARRVGAIAHRWLLAAGEGAELYEAVLEGCSPKHERWRRGGAMAKKTGGGLSSLQGRRKARGSSGVRGRGAVRPRVLGGLYRGPGIGRSQRKGMAGGAHLSSPSHLSAVHEEQRRRLEAGALSCDGGENRARAPPAHEPAGLTDKGGGPGISGPAQKVWAGWAKFNGEF
jgi:hypothetical protein